MEVNETTHVGVDKVTRYGWTLADKPGVLMEINKRELMVDHSYQRHVGDKDAKVKRMAAEWSWVACGAIIVGMRDGVAHVIDGQHRVLAAMKRSDVKKLPCVVFDTHDPREEAAGFLRANRNRKPMTATQAFSAMLATGDRAAVKVDILVRAAGRLIRAEATSPVNVTCVGALMECVSVDEPAFDRVWPVIIAVCADHSINQDLVRGMHYAERFLEGDSISTPRWAARAGKLGAARILDGIYRAKGFYGRGGAKVAAMGIVEALNKGMRQPLLKLSTE